MFEGLPQILFSFWDRYGYLAVFILIFLEEAGIFLPLPGDVFIASLGVEAKNGFWAFFPTLLIVMVATVLGASILYFFARRFGRPFVLKYGHLIRLDYQKMAQMEKWLATHGAFALIVSRLTPGFRIVATVVAGIFEVPFSLFFFCTTVASVIWTTIYFSIGYFFGRNFLKLIRTIFAHERFFGLIIFLVIGFLIFLFFRVQKNNQKAKNNV